MQCWNARTVPYHSQSLMINCFYTKGNLAVDTIIIISETVIQFMNLAVKNTTDEDILVTELKLLFYTWVPRELNLNQS